MDNGVFIPKYLLMTLVEETRRVRTGVEPESDSKDEVETHEDHPLEP